MKSVKEFVALNIDETVPSALKYNKHIYKRLINRAIKQSIDNFECLDVAFVKSYLGILYFLHQVCYTVVSLL